MVSRMDKGKMDEQTARKLIQAERGQTPNESKPTPVSIKESGEAEVEVRFEDEQSLARFRKFNPDLIQAAGPQWNQTLSLWVVRFRTQVSGPIGYGYTRAV